MKIRSGFVSNSSSASFLATFKSDLSKKSVLNIINALNGKYKVESKSVVKHNNRYGLSYSTSMWNDWPEQRTVYNFVRMLIEDKNSDFKFIEFGDPDKEIYYADSIIDEWDPHDCDYRWRVIDPLDGVNKNEETKAKKQQEKIEIRYLEYLAAVGLKLSDEDIRKLAKFQLSR